ncbi:MAG: potassium channel family protein [Halieaceae bacterium]|jgi:hypothetical protein|nr:potassium channel family protein [Halieaceae bacterium]
MLELFAHITLIIGITLIAILIHYECLSRLNIAMIRINARPRVRILGGVVVAIFAHSIEVMIFALGYFFADRLGHGELTGAFSGTMADYIYFSYATFTTVGYGDIVATDRVRMLVGVESLTGFVLITWTASFLYLEMSRFWSNR